MASQITTAFVQEYKDTLERHLSQQKGSRLRKYVNVITGVKGEAYYCDQVGTNAGEELLTRNADSPLHNTPHSRRRVDPRDWIWGELIDEPDKLRMLLDPASAYLRSAIFGAGRFIDDRIIEAALGTAKTGKSGGTDITLSSDQKIVVANHEFDSGSGDVGLTVGKLIAARDILGAAEADDYDDMSQPPLCVVVTTRQISKMLTETEVTSADYASVKALVKGELDTFMGFKFVRTERLNADSNADTQVIAFHRDGISLAIWADIETNLSLRADKNFNPYAHAKMTVGATRLEEVKVVEIACDPS